ncbi:hypothetical protein Hanom_Chr10g00929281 [Helianthus anomalus]
MELIRIMVDAKYKNTQADIKGIKEHLLKITCVAPTQIIPDDDAKKGEKDSLRKLPPDLKAKPKVQQKPESAQQQSFAKASEAGKEKRD